MNPKLTTVSKSMKKTEVVFNKKTTLKI